MQLPDSPQIRTKIALAKKYGNRIKTLSTAYDVELERIWKRHLQMLKASLSSDGMVKSILDSLIDSLRELLLCLIEGSMRVACEREGVEDTDMQILLLQTAVPQCSISYYEDTLVRYRSILESEMAFAGNNEISADLDLFLLNPMAYMSGRKNGLLALKEGIGEVSKGVSYSLRDNMKKLGISVAALAYTNAEYELWKNTGLVSGYIGVRNSSYPCPLCDSYAYRFIPMAEGMVYPLHNRCVCSIVPLHQNEIL